MIIFLKLLFGLIVLTIAGLWIVAFFIAKDIRQDFPPIGVFKTINGAKLHFIDTGQAENDDNHPVIFIHGAGGNLNDPIPMYQNQLKGKIRAIFLDRPGQGYSESFDNSNDVSVQTSSIAKLMDELNIPKAIIVGHSFGGALATSFGVLYPKKTAGLVLLAPVTHPWDTGIDWHYHLGNVPILGWVFSNTIAPIAGNFIYPGAIKRLFLPNGLPSDYEEKSATRLALLPENFHSNAKDIAGLLAHVKKFKTRYKEITAPTYIFHGDKDDIVSLEIHSKNGLAKDIKGSKLIILEGVGHKPDYLARDQIIKSIMEIANQTKSK